MNGFFKDIAQTLCDCRVGNDWRLFNGLAYNVLSKDEKAEGFKRIGTIIFLFNLSKKITSTEIKKKKILCFSRHQRWDVSPHPALNALCWWKINRPFCILHINKAHRARAPLPFNGPKTRPTDWPPFMCNINMPRRVI